MANEGGRSYYNCYRIVEEVMQDIQEWSETILQGGDSYTTHVNEQILRKVNLAMRKIYNKLMTRIPHRFLTSTDISGSSGVFNLPWDYGRDIRFEDSDALKAHGVSVHFRPKYGTQGSEWAYYRKGNQLILTDTSKSETYTLWYFKKPRDLVYGKATDADTLDDGTNIFPAAAIADYYNNMTIEDITGDQSAEITDYSAARVITSSITLAQNSYYGIVPDMPEEFHHLIGPLAVILLKATSPHAKEKPSRTEILLWQDMYNDALSAFAMPMDHGPEDIWCDFGGLGGTGIELSQLGGLFS